jgi:MFS family permease
MGRPRDTHLLVAAVGVSSLGDFLVWIPLTLHLERTTGSGFAVAGLMICLWAPAVLLAPVAGLLADRIETRTLLVAGSIVQAVVAAALALALDSVAATLALTALLGAGIAITQPAEFALVPAVARGQQLRALNGAVESARYAGMTAGPVLGGLLAAAGGTSIALLVNAATFAFVAAAAALLQTRRPPVPEARASAGAFDGVAHLFRDRTLALVVSVVLVSLLFMSAAITAEVFFLKGDLGVGDALYGVLFSSWAVGMVVGAMVVARRVPARALAAVALLAVAVQGIGLGLPTAWVAAGFVATAWFVGGVAHGVKNTLMRTLIQERVPDHLHGRAFAGYNGLRNGAELAALASGGALVALLGARSTLALAGALPVLAALVGLAAFSRVGGLRGVRARFAPPVGGASQPSASASFRAAIVSSPAMPSSTSPTER